MLDEMSEDHRDLDNDIAFDVCDGDDDDKDDVWHWKLLLCSVSLFRSLQCANVPYDWSVHSIKQLKWWCCDA